MPDFIVVNRPLDVGDGFVLNEFVEGHVIFFKVAQPADLAFFILFTLKLRIKSIALRILHNISDVFRYHFVHDLNLLFLIFLLVSFRSSTRLTFLIITVLVF